jgi:hypothetical protein
LKGRAILLPFSTSLADKFSLTVLKDEEVAKLQLVAASANLLRFGF